MLVKGDADDMGSSFQDTIDIVNSLRLKQNGYHFADQIFKFILLNENCWILVNFFLKLVS